MKKLEINELELINAGGYKEFTTGFCGGVGTAAAVLALTGVGAPAAVATLAYAGLACGGLAMFW